MLPYSGARAYSQRPVLAAERARVAMRVVPAQRFHASPTEPFVFCQHIPADDAQIGEKEPGNVFGNRR